jgi:hypothetical protein
MIQIFWNPYNFGKINLYSLQWSDAVEIIAISMFISSIIYLTLSIGKGKEKSQLTFSGQYINRYFTLRPIPLPNGEQLYQSTSFYLAGFTWSKRVYMTDELIYSYGITEDIPKGYKYELVAGYDRSDSSITRALSDAGCQITYEDNTDSIPVYFTDLSARNRILIVYTPAILAESKILSFFRNNGYKIARELKF